MAWDFETDPEFQKDLDWIAEFGPAILGRNSVGKAMVR